MTTTTIPETLITSVTVKSKAEEAGGYVLELDIPAFQSSYPTKVTKVKPGVAAGMKPGQAAMVELVRENLKKDKSGTKHYDFYWRVERLALPNEQPTSPQPSQGAPQGGLSGASGRDATGASIEAQVAVKEAAAVLRDMMLRMEGVTDEQKLEFYRLNIGKVTLWSLRAIRGVAEHIEAAPEPPPATQPPPATGAARPAETGDWLPE